MTWLISTSLKVVSIAAVFCASLRRRAIVCRSLDMRTRSSRSASAWSEGARWAAGAGTAGGRRHFHRHLVGFKLDQRLIDFHRIALRLEPFPDRRLCDRFTQLRHADFLSHDLSYFKLKRLLRSGHQRVFDKRLQFPLVLAHQAGRGGSRCGPTGITRPLVLGAAESE